jgi:hypothetical protein
MASSPGHIYKVSYRARRRGQYMLVILYGSNMQHVPGSPYLVLVEWITETKAIWVCLIMWYLLWFSHEHCSMFSFLCLMCDSFFFWTYVLFFILSTIVIVCMYVCVYELQKKMTENKWRNEWNETDLLWQQSNNNHQEREEKKEKKKVKLLLCVVVKLNSHRYCGK